MRILAAICFAIALAAPARADLPLPQSSPQVQVLEVGVYCQPETVRREEAPDTALGYIRIYDEPPQILFPGQQVPMMIGVTFGIRFLPAETIPGARMETYKPGSTTPEIWYTDYTAGAQSSRGFSLEFPEELIPGRWRLEAWDGDRLLYSIAYDLLPPEQLPRMAEMCRMMMS